MNEKLSSCVGGEEGVATTSHSLISESATEVMFEVAESLRRSFVWQEKAISFCWKTFFEKKMKGSFAIKRKFLNFGIKIY